MCRARVERRREGEGEEEENREKASGARHSLELSFSNPLFSALLLFHFNVNIHGPFDF